MYQGRVKVICIRRGSGLYVSGEGQGYCGGVECPALEKSPDLGNSSPDPRAFMYIESATNLSSGGTGGGKEYTYEKNR